MRIYNRDTKQIEEEKQYMQEILEKLYNTILGRIVLKLWFINPIYSKIVANKKKKEKSTKEIMPFVAKYNIKLEQFEKNNYASFNDFFIRKYKKEFLNINKEQLSLIAPAESKLMVFDIEKNLEVNIKGTKYNFNEIVKNDRYKDKYLGGKLLIFRLSVSNYHRYIYIDNGKLINKARIKGKLHTVSSISKNYKIYKENSRILNEIKYQNLDEVLQIEVGAIQVGKIINNNKNTFQKGDEKGYFEYGGSSIILIIQKDRIKLDDDIVKYSKLGIETKVRIGEKIGEIR